MTGKNERDLLYHYTDVGGLVGILRTGKIRMSDPRFLNDAREMIHGREHVVRAIWAVAETFRTRFADLGYDHEKFNDLVRAQINQIRYFAPPDFFHGEPDRLPLVACFSKAENQLSQWRAYGRGHYSIGFDRAFLESKKDIFIQPVKYSDPGAPGANVGFMSRFPHGQQGHDIQGAFMHILRSLAEKRFDVEVKNASLEHFVRGMNNNHFLLLMKHISFEEEKEVRIIKYVKISDSEIWVTDGSRYPSMRIDHPIFETKKEVNSAIKCIWSGPGADASQAGASRDILRKQFGYDGDWFLSDSPYRQA